MACAASNHPAAEEDEEEGMSTVTLLLLATTGSLLLKLSPELPSIEKKKTQHNTMDDRTTIVSFQNKSCHVVQ